MIEVWRYTTINCVRHYRLYALATWLPPEAVAAAAEACVKAGSLALPPGPVAPPPPPVASAAAPAAPPAPSALTPSFGDAGYPNLPGLFGLPAGELIGGLGSIPAGYEQRLTEQPQTSGVRGTTVAGSQPAAGFLDTIPAAPLPTTLQTGALAFSPAADVPICEPSSWAALLMAVCIGWVMGARR